MEVGKSTIEYVGADEGIGPYKVQRKIEEMRADRVVRPYKCCERRLGNPLRLGINRGEDGQNFHRMTVEGCV